MRRTAWGGCAAAVVLVLAAVACTGQGGGGQAPPSTVPAVSATPTVHSVVLPEPAPASKQWIADELAGMRLQRCPVPALSNPIVLDDDGQDRADVLWLVDDSHLCSASLTRVDGGLSTEIYGNRTEVLTARHKPKTIGDYRRLSFFTFFPGDVGKVELRGDDTHLFGPVHQRVVDLGGGKAVTVVQYAYAEPVRTSDDPPRSPQPTWTPGSTAFQEPELCPSGLEPCRSANV
ncbi:hypothetical protein [Kitasatospora sp. NPDC093102]|uniref:hypothetical protein n=1 Tax=Kitasatospora sp. NPDC093102 TaxID=3155069 RepID=UPI0034463DC9